MISILGYEIFDILYWFVPEKYFELLYHVVMFLRLWCAGISFIAFCLYQGNKIKESIFCSYIYCFCGYAVLATCMQPYFVSMFYYFPCILLGVEVQLKRNKSLLLGVFVFLSIMCSINLFYYTTVAVGIYCLVRFYFSDKMSEKKLVQALRLARGYILGILISAFISFPIIITIFSSSRIGTTLFKGNWITYGIKAILNTFTYFFIWNDSYITSEWGYLGLSAFCMPAIILLYIHKKKNTDLKVWLLIILVLMQIPVFGYFAGISTVNNRWTFCLAFVVAYICVRIMPQMMFDTSQNEKILINSFAILYSCVILSWAIVWKNMIIFLESISILGIMVVLNFIWRKKLGYFFVFTFFIIYGVFASMLNAYCLEAPRLATNMVDRGGAKREISNFVDCLYNELSDETFYRIDKGRCYDELGCNLPYWYGYNGISSFANMINPVVQKYYFKSGNVGMLHSSKISDLDSKATDEALASVKYYFTDKQNDVIPFGFVPFDSQINSNKRIYKNNYPLPIGYSYAESIDYDTYCLLNPAEQQEVMLKAVVLECPELRNNMPNLGSMELDYTIQEIVNLEKNEKKWIPNKEFASLKIETYIPENYEIYLVFNYVQNKSQSCKVNVQAWNFEDSFVSDSIYSNYGNKQPYFVLNLGYDLKGKTEVEININRGQGIVLDGLHLFARNMDNYIQDITELAENSMKNVIFSTNRVEGEISVIDDRFLCFSIPFSKGWKCYIDSKEVPLEKANMMYMGVPVSAGKHRIELRYFPYGMKVGLCITCSTLFIILCTKMKRKKLIHRI